MNNKFKIKLHSGLGDVFRLLSEHTSISLFYKTHGLTLYWVYEDYDLEDYKNPEQYTDSVTRPMNVIVHDVLGNVPFLNLVSQAEFNNLEVPELANWYNYNTDNIVRLRDIFPNEEQGFNIPISIREQDENNTLLSLSKKTACVHVSGRGSGKEYTHYPILFKMLLSKHPDLTIFLIDRPGKEIDSKLLFDTRIVNLVDKVSRVQEINLIQRVNYLICPCSYSKYARRWVNGKQTILACHYDYLSDSSTLNDVFGHYKYNWRPGLIYNPKVKVLGATYPLEHEMGYSYTRFTEEQCSITTDINLITPEEIFNSIEL